MRDGAASILYRVRLLDSLNSAGVNSDPQNRSSCANLQVRKGGLPPLERQRRDCYVSFLVSAPQLSHESFQLEDSLHSW